MARAPNPTEEKFKILTFADGQAGSNGIPTPCAVILNRLHRVHDRLRESFPDEFKDTIKPPAVQKWGGYEEDEDDQIVNDEDDENEENGQLPNPHAPMTEQDQALLLMQDEKTGWSMIAKLGWTYKLDGAITATQLRNSIAGVPGGINPQPGAPPYKAAAVLRAMNFWFENFASAARRENKLLDDPLKWDKNSVYQLIAHGKELFESALRTPDLLEFVKHQTQEVDLPKALSAAEIAARKR